MGISKATFSPGYEGERKRKARRKKRLRAGSPLLHLGFVPLIEPGEGGGESPSKKRKRRKLTAPNLNFLTHGRPKKRKKDKKKREEKWARVRFSSFPGEEKRGGGGGAGASLAGQAGEKKEKFGGGRKSGSTHQAEPPL